RRWLAALAADRDFDPVARGRLRGRWLTIAAMHHDPRMARDLIDAGLRAGPDPIKELSLQGLLVLAEQLIASKDTVRSSALALLELARRRAPTDEEVRGRLLYVWNEFTRWSRRRPVAETDFSLQPVGEWLLPREVARLDPGDGGPTWLRLLPGQPAKVRAELSGGLLTRDLENEAVVDPRRMRLFDVHVSTPIDSVEPVRLRVDDQEWWSPQLRGVVRHRVAVAGGVHEVVLDGPEGTMAWAELPPADELAPRDPALLGRKEQMWPLSQVRWRLPGPPVPGYARLELRWPADQEPGPVRITAHQDGEIERAVTMIFDPRSSDGSLELDPSATPLGASPKVGLRHDVVVPVDADTKWIWFEVEGQAVVAGALSLRRALYPNELDPADDVVRPRVEGREQLLTEVFAELTALDGEALLDELVRLSRILLLTPEDLDERARRAALLLMLGETGHARADLLRLAGWADRGSLDGIKRERADALLTELERRFDALIEPREIVVDAELARPQPVLVEPALAAVVGADRTRLEPWLDRWAAWRAASPDDALLELELGLVDARADLAEAREAA
ncbi:MAG: hypothetical protein KC431_03255, partial [Myxococcales bacterium]|nr:hypothetical protein [Myxococcales bacterium]